MSSNPTPEQQIREALEHYVDLFGPGATAQKGLDALARLVAELEEAQRLSETHETNYLFQHVRREAAEAQVAALREALEEAVACTGPWGLGAPPALCPRCAEKARAALAGVPAADPAPPPPEGASDNWAEDHLRKVAAAVHERPKHMKTISSAAKTARRKT